MRTLATDGTADQLLDYWRANGSGKQPMFRPASWRRSRRPVTERLRLERLSVGPHIKTRPELNPDPAGGHAESLRLYVWNGRPNWLLKWVR